MPSLWLIFRVRRSAPESRLPMVVWSSLVAHDSVMRRFYVPLIPLGSNGDENRRAPTRVYWTLCWDSKINVDRQYYNFQHSERVDFAFVRVDHDGMLPNVSKMDASWDKVKDYVHELILRSALALCLWSSAVRQVSGPMRRRVDIIESYLRRFIDRGIWLQCYWCDYWVENPHNIARSGCPLCDWCYDWYGAGGGPYEPTALQRSEKWLKRFWRNLPEILCRIIASFLCDWVER